MDASHKQRASKFALAERAPSGAGRQPIKTARRADRMARRASRVASYRAGYVLCEADRARWNGWHFGRSSAVASFGAGCVCGQHGRANAACSDKIATIKF